MTNSTIKSTASKILLVEDDEKLASLVQNYLQQSGFEVKIESNGDNAVELVSSYAPDLLILDIMLPGKDGLTICQEIGEFSDTPIIMTTAKIDEVDRLIGLKAGADDYVCKPYSPREVVARVKICLRRMHKLSTLNDLVSIDEQQLSISLNEQSIALTLLEFSLFRLLYNNPQRIFSRQHIIDHIYHDYRIVSEQTVNSHIRNLRKKLTKLSPDHELIYSIYAVGYRYVPLLLDDAN
jgi:two-component system response regulator BaeR